MPFIPSATLLVDIHADITCAWCLLGRHRLGRALAARPGVPVILRWRPYQLHPALPPGGVEYGLHQRLHHGGPTRAHQARALMQRTAALDGVALGLDRISRTPNTLNAHRLLRLAGLLEAGGNADGATRMDGTADRLAQALMLAYLRDGRDVGESGTLLAIWREQGLPLTLAADLLAGDGETRAVLLAGAHARQRGIHTLPCLIFQERYAVAGAQDPTTLQPLIDLALSTESAGLPQTVQG